MTAVQVMDIKVLDNPCSFLEPFRFEITFDATQKLEEDLEWRLTYVGSADSEIHDQVLDSVLVGPIPLGRNRFVFEAPAPDPTRIPAGDLLGVTVVLLECLYKDKVFVRVGYYVSNENPDDPPAPLNGGEMDGNSRLEEVDADAMDVEDIKSESEGEGEGDDDGEEEIEKMMISEGADAKENIIQSEGQQQQQQPAQAKKPIVEIPPSKIRRFILEDKPRVTRFPIEWDSVASNGNDFASSSGVESGGMMMGGIQAVQ
jgi:histone chaperone ASF1